MLNKQQDILMMLREKFSKIMNVKNFDIFLLNQLQNPICFKSVSFTMIQKQIKFAITGLENVKMSVYSHEGWKLLKTKG